MSGTLPFDTSARANGFLSCPQEVPIATDDEEAPQRVVASCPVVHKHLLCDASDLVGREAVVMHNPENPGEGAVCDLEEMTYAEVFRRFVELSTFNTGAGWIDPSYQGRLFNLLARVEQRFFRSE